MPEEIFDVVDQDDRVIGQAPRSEVHARNLLHRAASIFVFNARGELLVQLRSTTKDQYPSCFTSSASGHLEAGEDYAQSAQRELFEEVGLSSPLEFLTKLPANGAETAYEFTALFRTVTDQTPTFDPDEVAGGEFVELSELRRRVATDPEQYTPPFRVLLEWYWTHEVEARTSARQ